MQHAIHQYQHYTVPQLLTTPYFLEWVRFPDATNTAFWQLFITTYPERAEDVKRAAAIAKGMHTIDETPVESRWDNIYKEIHTPQVRYLSYLWKAAAMVLVVSVASWMLFRNKPVQKIEITSRFGEVKHITLPDSTTIVLNGNSRISYNKNWDKREIWIDGEAFFDVKHTDTKGFGVHTAGLEINVLGTSFNVRNRRGITAVVLNSGKVMVAAEDHKQLVLSKPGEMALYDKQLTKKQVPVDHYTSWQQQKLQLDQVSVEDFFAMLEDDWGYTIQLNDTSLLRKKISGEIDMKDKQVLMDALAIILHADVKSQGSTITVTPTN